MQHASQAGEGNGPLARAYEAHGYVSPIEVLDEAEAASLLEDLESAEAAVAADRRRLSMLRAYTSRLLPSFDALIRHPRLIEAVSPLIGPDLLVWGTSLFVKEAESASFVSWHQDLNYWGLDGEDEVTAWVALTPATVENGCMRFIPGSHRIKAVDHVDTFARDNLLSRGQELAVKVDEAQAVDVVLRAGQASLHHGHLFHASGPNRTSGRRVGVAIRYISPSMRQTNAAKLLAAHVSGRDEHGHFDIAPPPAGRLLEAEFERCARNIEVKQGIIYRGVKAEQVKQTPKV
jgi:ectoine hydroxylase-related dioxygenase (phytanoyl-CoA dioxygenase family)